MPRRSKEQMIRAELIAKIPIKAHSVYVRTEKGDFKYRPRLELADADEIQTKADGSPVVMMCKPGRRKNVFLKPKNSVIAEMLKQKAERIENDTILQAARKDPESLEVLQEVFLGLGEEAASIHYERIEAERNGKETSTLSGKRVTALKAAAEIWLKRKEQLTSRGVDIKSPVFKSVFEHVMNTMKEAMVTSGMRAEAVESVFNKFSGIVDTPEWEAEIQNIIKGVR